MNHELFFELLAGLMLQGVVSFVCGFRAGKDAAADELMGKYEALLNKHKKKGNKK